MSEAQNDCLCHVSFQTSSHANGRSAINDYNYITRLQNHEKKEDLIYSGSINMPMWANNPADFWDMCTQRESYQGRQAININLAFPRELKQEDNIKLLHDFINHISTTKEGVLPCSYGYHFDKCKTEPNPHFHTMIYERPINEISTNQTPDLFFTKANRDYPERGGEKKITFYKNIKSTKKVRVLWANLANKYLSAMQSPRIMNPHSHAQRGLLQIPQIHLGAKSSYQFWQGKETIRTRKNNLIKDINAKSPNDLITEGYHELKNIYDKLENGKLYYASLPLYEKQRLFDLTMAFTRVFQEESLEEGMEFFLDEYKEREPNARLKIITKSLILRGFEKKEILKAYRDSGIACEIKNLSETFDMYYYDILQEFEWIWNVYDCVDDIEDKLIFADNACESEEVEGAEDDYFPSPF